MTFRTTLIIMDLFDVILQIGLFLAVILVYVVWFRRSVIECSRKYNDSEISYLFKYLWIRILLKRWKWMKSSLPIEVPHQDQTSGWDDIRVKTSSLDGTALYLGIRKIHRSQEPIAEVCIHIALPDGTIFQLPKHPQTATEIWQSTSDGWSAGGLKLSVIEPDESMRITFNGLLTNSDNNSTQHVKFNLFWISGSDKIKHPDDWDENFIVETLLSQKVTCWTLDTLNELSTNNWHQWGIVQGRFICYDERGSLHKNVYVRTRGVRERNWNTEEYRKFLSITATGSCGTNVQLYTTYVNNNIKFSYGSVRTPDCEVRSITNADLRHKDENDELDVYLETLNISTKHNILKLITDISGNEKIKFHSGAKCEFEESIRTFKVQINAEEGTGFIVKGDYSPVEDDIGVISNPKLKWLREEDIGDFGYCLSFNDKTATCPSVVGGKGASLALLSSVQNEMGYKVPPGFCLTVNALDTFVEEHKSIKEAITLIEDDNENNTEHILQHKCTQAVTEFLKAEISGTLKSDILSSLQNLRIAALAQNFGPELRFAVRSSAVGEDSEVLSAAGQNESILGCKTDDEVLEAVRKCWASMFAYISVYYRRQNGQPCFCGGAVVVQVLAPAQAAGVMFTRHPDAGDPSRILVTANYGLGESVVSGTVEPDTIIIKRENNQLKILDVTLGSKATRVTTKGSSIVNEDNIDTDRRKCCLTDAQVLALAELGVMQDQYWGAGRDIEWTVCGDDFYLLQARPITSLDRWTEEELLHEMDHPIMADDDLMTFANTGEVMPKPITPLTYSLITTPLCDAMNSQIGCSHKYDKGVTLTHNRLCLNCYNTMYRVINDESDLVIKMIEMAVHGHRVADDKILNIARHRRKPHWRNKLRQLHLLGKNIGFSVFYMKDALRAVEGFHIDKTELDDPVHLLEAIESSKSVIARVSLDHGITTSTSSTSQIIAMSALLEGKSDFTTEQCNEIAVMFSHAGDVLSAEVPRRLAYLADCLEKSGLAEEFRYLDPRDGMRWLKDKVPDIYEDVTQLLKQHGHRGLQELDLYTKPWSLVPEELVKALQNMRTAGEAKVVISDSEIINSLKTPQKPFTRKILRWLLPFCRRAIRHREITKAQLVLVTHKIRLAVRRLGSLLVARWYLPDVELIFFFRLQELRNYLKTRDPAYLKKATQRRQYYSGWCKLKFSEMQEGWPEPQRPVEWCGTGEQRVKGTAVCGGEVRGRACVVNDLTEIDQLVQGDILITHSTDIGWSPYFPLVKGIVTELGGLISHGAVIAREYGLPCVVGATNATNVFNTGDIVRLSATEGVIERLRVEPS